MALAKKYSVTDVPTKIITGYAGRDEIILRVASGANTVWISPDDSVTDSAGFFMEAKDTIVLTGEMASKSYWAVCASGETSTIYGMTEA